MVKGMSGGVETNACKRAQWAKGMRRGVTDQSFKRVHGGRGEGEGNIPQSRTIALLNSKIHHQFCCG